MMLVLAQLDAGNQAPLPGAIQVLLTVGEQKPSPVARATGVNCDDKSIAEVLDLGDRIELKGRVAGRTLCAFNQGRMPPKVVEITVRK